MPAKITFDTVQAIGLAMPDVEVSTAYGATCLKLRGHLLACPALNKSAEPNTLVVKVSFDQRDALLTEAPDIFYVTDHYVNYPSVLVRLPRIRLDVLRDLLRTSWQFVNTQKPTGKRKKRAIRR
jgi:hypothetical protein